MANDIEHLLEDDMGAYGSGEKVPDLPSKDVPFRAWRPPGAYPSDFDRKPLLQNTGPEWDFYPSRERWEDGA